jgi:hypothetical protein
MAAKIQLKNGEEIVEQGDQVRQFFTNWASFGSSS